MYCYTKNALEPVSGTILFLGDSISDLGQYVSFLNGWLALCGQKDIHFINAGLSSETCAGTSEPAHPFPRPCALERIDRVLNQVHPDWIVLCYGINDGIYYPFDEERFSAYTRGMTDLLVKAQAQGIKAAFMTPLVFDAASFDGELAKETQAEFSFMRPYEHYDDVMAQYSQWVLSQGSKLADLVIDLRTPLLADMRARRIQNPAYSSGDGIHPNLHGHAIIAQTILKTLFGVESDILEEMLMPPDFPLFELLYERDQLEHIHIKEQIGHSNPNKTVLPKDWQASVDALNRKLHRYLQTSGNKRMVCSCWNGFETERFYGKDGYEIIVAKPHSPAEGRPWVWRAEFFGAFPQADVALLQRGWHVVQIRIADLYGCPIAIALMERFYQEITARYLLAPAATLFGFSRGALYAVNYAAAYPQHVQLLYLDAPVVDMRSWPGGLYTGSGSAESWRQCQLAYGASHSEYARLQQTIQALLCAKIPLLLVAGDSDTLVPFCENGMLLQTAYEASDIPFQLILKKNCGHHPHSLKEPAPILPFLLQQSRRCMHENR
ncbi:MAG: GDSL-type esterase/lipase family protein [Clostridia bacterium]